MITDKYCSFELCKLLKDNGFVEPVRQYYDLNGNICAKYIEASEPLNNETYVRCPTYEVVADWLLENYFFHIELEAYPHEDGCFYWFYKIMHLRKDCVFGYFKLHQKSGFNTKYDALDNAYTYILNKLIYK